MYKYKVDLVFNGHAHQYARTYPIKPVSDYPFGIRDDENGVVQIITGGGGAPLSSVKKTMTTKLILITFWQLPIIKNITTVK